MKHFNNLSMLVLALLFCGQFAYAEPPNPFIKEFRESFALSPNGQVVLDNRYGKIDVTTWDQDKVEIKVTITVKSGSRKDAEEVFSNIRILFQQSGDKVTATTVLDGPEGNRCLSGSKNMDCTIDYQVNMPATAQLDLRNSYGDVFVEKLMGKSRLDVNYGSLKTGPLTGDAEVHLAYGKGHMEALRNATLVMKYSSLDIQDARQLKGNTAYSKMALKKSDDLNLTGKYDDYTLGAIKEAVINIAYGEISMEKSGNFHIVSKYTNFDIGRLEGRLDANLAYGNLRVHQIASRFTGIDVIGKYSDVLLATPEGDFQVYIVTKHGGIVVPGQVVKTANTFSGTLNEVRGYSGSLRGGKNIDANLNYGSFKMK